MTNAELLAKIKAEIERRLKDYWEISFHDTNSYNKDTNVKELKELLSFLSTLESEKPMQEGLEEEIKSWIPPIKVKVDEDVRGIMKHIREWGELIARHFAEWGYLRAAEKYNEIEYNRQRAEEDTPNDLEEAVEKQIDEALFKWSYDDEDGIEQYVEDAFIAGADWQKEQGVLVHGEVELDFSDPDDIYARRLLIDYYKELGPALMKFNPKDKVIIQIRKEKEQ